VNGRQALSWVADFKEGDRNQSEYFTLIFGDKTIASIWFAAPTARIEEMRPSLEQFIASVRLP
jgi:hypothetical protein